MRTRHLGQMTIMITAGLALLLSSGGKVRADLLTVTFNSLPADFSEISSYTENGFTVFGINRPPLTHFFTVTNPDNGTTAAAFFETDGVPMGFNFGGTPFDLISIDVPNISGQATFTSSSGAMTVVTERDEHKTISFGPGFQGITSFQLSRIERPLSGFEGFIVIDNLVFAPIPEPGSLALFVTAAVGLMAYRWRRREQGV